MARQFGLKYTTPELHKVSTQINFLQLNRNAYIPSTRNPLPPAAPSPQLCILYWLFLLRSSRLTRGPTH